MGDLGRTDGERFLVYANVESSRNAPLQPTAVGHWFDELEEKVPKGR